ncbi:MAG: hypothetical protein A3E21_09425 [Sulfurimonas sp. RIFCSPHIGHO2_12_FULL_36_9]|uniref:hypothetical protein n=1 Tax=Sulfurimonas sp. RIFCSPLOWO2_12_36_12 TaxID=1802253 RepID=UPI0008AC1B73|nr:hypothetical protein [Sulfurimonas sp. RIFCSPLOWO2_12_36_12]OHD96721.1 MAG: hypothetical protein A3E21_09425 [Sulfurimonas sp. RIFCSPHIGHO2_12_FULL_36_9]OHE00278.1 MAG: hypothetical protein A3J26_06655 [Sulfurimonas sp. RIFCSPLOWO2_02_FULL_36_28]OHE02111.1 MAG: hypothetical protein A2W82_05350 [Sulfurimonas sp. RIFCSPLOWO2_12_36_12]
MTNLISSWFSSHNSYKQTNIETQNNYSSEVKTLLESVDGYFYDGNIREAFEFLDKAIERQTHKESKYFLLLKKIEYFLECRNIKEAKKYLDLIKKNYADYIGVKYKEHLLFIYSLEHNKNEYLTLVGEIKLEKSDIKSDEYFNLIYALNSGDSDEAKKIFNSLVEDERNKNNLIAGHVFANSYRITNDLDDLKKATEYYQLLLNDNPKFLIKLHILGFFVSNIINNYFQTKNEFDKKQVIEYKQLLKTIFEVQKYFNNNYINDLKKFHAFILLILNFKDEYIKFYEEHQTVLFDEHYLQYAAFKQANLEHKKIQKRVFQSDRVLFNYASLMLETVEQQEVIKFFVKNIELLLKSDLIVYFYIQSSISLKYSVEDKVVQKINLNKQNSYELYLSHLWLKHHNQDEIQENEIKTLLAFVEDKSNTYAKVLEVIDLLEKIKKPELYIKFAISKISLFENLTYYILRKCWFDRELKLDDFEIFVRYIDDIKCASYIADVYFKYDRFDKAFEYFYKSWESDRTIVNAKNLLSVSVQYHERFHNRLNEEIENEALSFLQIHKKDLDFNDIGFISFYSLVVNKDVDNAFGIINKKVLSINVYELDNLKKQSLSSLYFNSIINFDDNNENLSDKNIIFIKNNAYYLNKKVFDDIHEIYFTKLKIELVDETEIKRIKLDQAYEKKSLFHFIVNQILHTISSPYFKMIQVDLAAKTPFVEMQELLIEQSNQTEDQLTSYSDGSEIGFWTLAGTYEKYFNLVAKLIEDPNLNFISCHMNYKDSSVPKLITLSSMIFLNYHNKLDDVLKRDDVYIQKTSYDWLHKHINELDKQDEIFSVFAKDGFFYKDIVSKEQIQIFSNRLKEIILSIDNKKIVDDTKASLPFKGAFSLSKYLGIQEYQALALHFQENYQIITEDKIFEVLFESLNFNQTMISNSLALVDEDDFLDFALELHSKKYKYVFNPIVLENLVKILTKTGIVNSFSEKDIKVLQILDDYKWLEGMKQYYHNTYSVLYPKATPPKEDYISKNIEYILQCLNTNFLPIKKED